MAFFFLSLYGWSRGNGKSGKRVVLKLESSKLWASAFCVKLVNISLWACPKKESICICSGGTWGMSLILAFVEAFTVKRPAKGVDVCMQLCACFWRAELLILLLRPVHAACSVPAPPRDQSTDCQSAVFPLLCSRGSGRHWVGVTAWQARLRRGAFKCGVINASVNCGEEVMDFSVYRLRREVFEEDMF